MTDNQQYLLVEYEAAQASYLHHDGHPWQVGSLLIAGVFVFWGLILDKSPTPSVIAVASVLVIGLVSAWMLYAHQARQIYICKLHRIREIERELKMEQHRRFVKTEETTTQYRYFGPSGYQLNLAIYAIASLGGLVLGYWQTGWSKLYILPITMFALILFWVLNNERRLKLMLRDETSKTCPNPLAV